jgi:hypothetical protein
LRQDAGYGGIGCPERRKLEETCHVVGMACPDAVNLAGGAVVAVVVAVVDVAVPAAVVVVVVTTVVGATVVAVVEFGVTGVAGFAVDAVADASGAAGDWVVGAAEGRAIVDDVVLASAVGAIVGCCSTGGAAVSGAPGAAAADFVTSGTALPGSTAAGTSGTVPSTTTVVSGSPGAPFFVTTCFFVTITTEAGPPESAGTPALADELKPRRETPESAATEIAPVATTSTPAVAEANAFFLNMGETVMIAWLAVD